MFIIIDMKNTLKKKIPNEFIIFDTEFTSWKGSQERNWSGKNEYMELVQIGALKVKKGDNRLEIVEIFSIFVKPKINPILSQYFINLTKFLSYFRLI